MLPCRGIVLIAIAKKILTKLGGLQEQQDKLEGELVEVRKEFMTMNKAVEKIAETCRKLLRS